jgi:hypothetical protein
MQSNTKLMQLDNRNVHVDYFDSFGEMLNYVESNPRFGQSDKDGTGDWDGMRNFAEASELARHGWHDVRPEVEKLLNQMSEVIADRLEIAPSMTWNVAGGVVDVGRYCGNEPMCMLDFPMEPQERMGKVVKLFIDYGASSGFSGDFIMKRGIVLLALVDTLQKLGVSVEIYGETAIIGNGAYHTTVTKLHDPTDRLDIDELMFTLAHPAMLRRMAFAVREMSTCSQAISAHNGGSYGRTVHTMYAPTVNADIRMERLESRSTQCMENPVEWVMQTITGLNLI